MSAIAYSGYTITIGKCQNNGWRDWYEYSVAAGGPKQIVGRSRGTKREVVGQLKWDIDHNESFKALKVQS